MSKGLLLAAALILAAPATMDGQTRAGDAQRRKKIEMMEGVLAKAVRQGAEEVGRQMMSIDPTSLVLTGQARARGFILEGYGVFFDVEIPALNQSVVWSVMTMQRDAQTLSALDAMRRVLEILPEGPDRLKLQQAFKTVEQRVAPVSQQLSMQSDTPEKGKVAAANAGAALALADPITQYTEEVKSALIDAMLDYSAPMELGPDEWLTVAARDSEGPLTPGEIYDASTIVLRVKGSDLAAYAADRTMRDEVRKRVEVRVF